MPWLQRINLTRGDVNRGRKIHINDSFSLRRWTNYPSEPKAGLNKAGTAPMKGWEEGRRLFGLEKFRQTFNNPLLRSLTVFSASLPCQQECNRHNLTLLYSDGTPDRSREADNCYIITCDGSLCNIWFTKGKKNKTKKAITTKKQTKKNPKNSLMKGQ